jgi:hypothetical protein
MMLTYCRDDEGQERLYLLPKATLEVWLAPDGADGRWIYHWQQADTDGTPDFERVKAIPVREALLADLAKLMGVPVAELPQVPFLDIARHAGLHPDQRTGRVANRRRSNSRSAGFHMASVGPR